MATQPTIIYTKTDEAPLLATYSLLPIIQAFTKHSGIKVEMRDISLAGRILAAFSDRLSESQKTSPFGDVFCDYIFPSIHTMSGAITNAGRKFPTRIFLISNKLLMPSPTRITPPVAVISFIIGSLMMELSAPASRLIPPW